jgi:hypothetical protein
MRRRRRRRRRRKRRRGKMKLLLYAHTHRSMFGVASHYTDSYGHFPIQDSN